MMKPLDEIVRFIHNVRPDLYPNLADAESLVERMRTLEVDSWASVGGFRFDRSEEGLDVSLNLGYVNADDPDCDWTWLGTGLEGLFDLNYGGKN